MNYKIRKLLKDFETESYVQDSNEEVIYPEDLLDCSLGVNPFGHAPMVDQWYGNDLSVFDISNYPEFPYVKLKQAICDYLSDYCAITPENIGLGTGSVVVLYCLNRMFIDNETKILSLAPSFAPYYSDVKFCGGSVDFACMTPEDGYQFSAETYCMALNDSYALAYLDNPNNPTGQVIPLEEIRKVCETAKKYDVCVIVDEAYGDFMPLSNSAVNLLKEFDNLIVVKTFSKGFGLAGLRAGYCILPKELSSVYSKASIPFSLNCFGYYSALHTLEDKTFLEESRQKIAAIKKDVIDHLTKLYALPTDLSVPIMTLGTKNKDIDLYHLFLKYHILTESGKDFDGLGKNYVRARVPSNGRLKEIIQKIEATEDL